MNVDVNRIFDQEYLDGNLIELADYFSKLNSSKSPESDYKELAWACLAKIVYQCEPSRLKSISSRLQVSFFTLVFRYVMIKLRFRHLGVSFECF